MCFRLVCCFVQGSYWSWEAVYCLSQTFFPLFKEFYWQVFDFGINPNWIFIYLVVCFCHKKRPDAVCSVPLCCYYCCTSIGLWWSIGIAWCFCIDYRNVSRWMELDSSPRARLSLFSRENCRSAEKCSTYFCWNLMVHPTPRHRPFFTEDPCQERCESQRNGQAAGSACLTQPSASHCRTAPFLQ